ncbi:hypothetical protein [Roseateles sp. PN1]|uniref:hypothetical protein n=1 Tax=Roseateles sp. PN1 TaxID=3137372 RepID=UPI003138B76A
MYLIAIAWGYVAVMMALAEATSSQGSILGAVITLLLYGVLPITILLYILGAPGRKAARKKQAMAEAELAAQAAATAQAQQSTQADGGDHAPAQPLPPVGKET